MDTCEATAAGLSGRAVFGTGRPVKLATLVDERPAALCAVVRGGHKAAPRGEQQPACICTEVAETHRVRRTKRMTNRCAGLFIDAVAAPHDLAGAGQHTGSFSTTNIAIVERA